MRALRISVLAHIIKSMKKYFFIVFILLLISGALFVYNKITHRDIQKNQAQISNDTSVTGTIKHSIALDEIFDGGVGKDGIPSIDNPKFISTDEADMFLDGESLGLGFSWKGESRFYPFQIMVWHEIVNDQIQGDPMLVTYCPLCQTGIVFDPKVDGKALTFGVSGKLWRSNLLMYDRESGSLWSQVLGEAVVGPQTGKKLKVLAFDVIYYGNWKKAHPDTKLLSRETGIFKKYGEDPYKDYYSDKTVGFGATLNDTRLHPKEFILGIELNGKYKAYRADAIKNISSLQDTFSGEHIEISKDEFGQVRVYRLSENKLMPFIGSFWFAWLAVHPDTELFSEGLPR